MLRAAVCDDERQFLLAMKELLQKTGRVERVQLFENGEELLETLEAGADFDVAFLDIDFHGASEGLALAARIYRYAPGCQIVYVTGYTDKYVQDIFLHTTSLCGFLKKPVQTEMLESFLKKAEKQIYGKLDNVQQRLPEGLFLRCHKSFLVNMEKILRLEANSLTLKNGQKIAISKRRLKNSKKKYFEYLQQSV